MIVGRIGLAATLAAGLGLTAANAATVELVNAATPGFYNNQIGDLGAPGNTWFPPANTFGGTQDLIFATPPDLSGATALGDWLTAPGSLGPPWSGPQAIPAGWAVNSEVAIVYPVDAGAGVAGVTASFGRIDNGVHVWVDGVWKFGARDPEGRAWSGIDLGDLGPGQHYIQILLEDSGGATVYSTPSISGTAVPVPAALPLFASALLGGLAGLRRGRQRGAIG
jgi:hypothetical protein